MASYADIVNSKYSNKADHYQDLKERFNAAISALPLTVQQLLRARLKKALKTFITNNPNYQKFSDLPLCHAQVGTLAQIIIDATMQRALNINWLFEILEKFRATQAMPIQVYRVMNPQGELSYLKAGEFYASWEGQHTAMVLFLIATMVFNEDPANVRIPVVIYDVSTKAEIRDNFIKSNTIEGKKLLDDIDIVQQQIYGVRVDGSKNPLWLQVEQKQTYLEQVGLFVTDKKFGDHTQPGAVTRVDDIMNEKMPVEVVRQFCVYAKTILEINQRPINTKEAPIILGFLKMAATGNIEYSDSEIRDLAMLCHTLFDADFDSDGPYWAQLETAYFNWWERFYQDVDPMIRPERPRMNKDWVQGGTFFWHQLKKSWQDDNGNAMPLPRLNINTQFIPNVKDLF